MKQVKALSVLSIILLGACAKPTEEECNKLGDHVLDIMVKEVGMEGMEEEMRKELEPERQKLVDECQKSGTKAEVECFMKAESLDDIDKCD